MLGVVGARPNFMKVAPIYRVLESNPVFFPMIVHTGQHYDERMSDIFFRQLEMPKPHIYLGVGSGTHAEQTARVMVEFEKVIEKEQPDLVIVVGDVNSTLACSLVAVKCHIPVAHVEAGLRSGDRRMPEEINRIATDAISDLLFVTERSGEENLKAEGVAPEKIHFVGNVMIDSLVHFRAKASQLDVLRELGVEAGQFALMTMHRPSNVDSVEGLTRILETIEAISGLTRIVFPVHPRTRQRMKDFGILNRLLDISNLTLLDPLGYLEFLNLMERAAVVITDSGGIQEETTFLGVPCLTLRENTERPVTIELGTNELVPLDPQEILTRVSDILKGKWKKGSIPPLWDGKASQRIVAILEERLA